MAQIQNKWVYKNVLKLTPSTLSQKLLKKKKKNWAAWSVFTDLQPLAPRWSWILSVLQLAHYPMTLLWALRKPQTAELATEYDSLLTTKQSILEKHFLSPGGKSSFNQCLFICHSEVWHDRVFKQAWPKEAPCPFFVPTTTPITKYCLFSCAVTTFWKAALWTKARN